MQKVASLRYEVIFKKAFCDVEVFKAFAKDFLGIDLKIDKVQTEKKFDPPIGNVDSRFDLYAEDVENRVIVDIQHRRYEDYYERFLHYHCAAILEQVDTSKNYKPALTVFTIVVSTSGTREDCAMAEINFDPINLLTHEKLNKIHHRVLYLSPKHVTENTPEPYREWLKLIQDSLDEQVDETSYHKTEVLKVVNLIKTDGLTPQDRARMKDEYSQEDAFRKAKDEGFSSGVEKGLQLGEERGREAERLEIAKNLFAQGLAIELIEQATGIHRSLFNS
ncbi:MAG: PD-(D/E)XK nuclease family transposase [Thiotrichaceae bacterium]|nr:PD-(D/E)XK nuclease family transposase [Thiotrichaceae bacterium]